MRADNEQKISSISKTEMKKNISVKDRLGLGGPEIKSSKSPLSTGKLFQTSNYFSILHAIKYCETKLN